MIGISVVVELIAGSYLEELLYPGEPPFLVRAVEWVRDHGGSPLVDAAENWWYARGPSSNQPTVGSEGFAGSLERGVGAPAALRPLSRHPSPGEGHWLINPAPDQGNRPMLWTVVHPDVAHPQVAAAVARFDQDKLSARLIAGTSQPEETGRADVGRIPEVLWPRLVAAFNSGFKMAEARGGFYADHRTIVPLRSGAASLVIDRTGRVSVDQWGRDRVLDPQVVAVRQNLALIVDHGRVVPGLADNVDQRWGSSRNEGQYTWRSAVGVDANGRLYYVAGDQLTLPSLARAIQDTGAVRAMELDIHPYAVHLFVYRHMSGIATPQPSPLLAVMCGPWTRYLYPDQRDFVVLVAR